MTRLPHLPVTTIVIGCVVVALAYLGFTTGRYVINNYRLRGDEQQLRRELRDLDRDRVQLEAARDYLKSDEYIEYMARRVLGLVRPGETLVVVSGNPPGSEPTPQATPGAPWWKQFFAEPDAAPTPVPPLAPP